MTTTPTTSEPTPRERGRQTCRAALMSIVSLHHKLDLAEMIKTDCAGADVAMQHIGNAVASLELLDGLRGDIDGEPSRREMGLAIQLDDISAAVRRALKAPAADTRPPLALVADLIEAAEEAGAEIEARDLEQLEARRYDAIRLMGLPSPIVVAKASAPDQTLPVYYQGSKVGEAEVRSQPERSVIVVVTGEQLLADMKRSHVEVSMSDEGGPAIYVRRRPGGFTPRTEVSEVKPAVFDAGSDAGCMGAERSHSAEQVIRADAIRELAMIAAKRGLLSGLTDAEIEAGSFKTTRDGLLSYLEAGATARAKGQKAQADQRTALEMLGWDGREAPGKFVFAYKQRLAALREMLRQSRGGDEHQMASAITRALEMLGNGSAEATPAQPVAGAL